MLKEILETGGSATFLKKMDAHKEALSSSTSARLILHLTASSDLFPDRSGFLTLSTMERAATLTSRLLERVTPDDRLDVTSPARLTCCVKSGRRTVGSRH